MKNKARLIATVLSGGAAAVVPWYRTGGAPAPVAAYQAIGAADAATSYVNLANPGTYNLTPDNAPSAPVFNTATGWAFTAALGLRLGTGIAPVNSQARTVIVRYTQTDFASLRTVWGERASNFYLQYNNTGDVTNHVNGATLGLSRITTGAVAISGGKGYLDGVDSGNIGTGTYQATHTIYIGCTNNGGTKNLFFEGTIQAWVYYAVELTPAQVLAVSLAMNALP